MNNNIILRESLGMMDAYEATGIIFLDLENLSSNAVSFPSDYGSKIYVREENEWQLIANNFNYSDSFLILPPETQYPPGLLISIKPILPKIPKPIMLRIVVIGEMVESDLAVGAYLDIVMN